MRLERYFGHPQLMMIEYRKRGQCWGRIHSNIRTHATLSDKPVIVMNPFLFITGDTEETIERTGFRQVQIVGDDNNNGVRGTNQRK